MRSFLTVGLMILSVTAFSFTEEGKGPREAEREQGRACFKEIKALGCGNPREVGRDAFKSCIDSKKESLSETCQAFQAKMKERRPPREGKIGHRGPHGKAAILEE